MTNLQSKYRYMTKDDRDTLINNTLELMYRYERQNITESYSYDEFMDSNKHRLIEYVDDNMNYQPVHESCLKYILSFCNDVDCVIN